MVTEVAAAHSGKEAAQRIKAAMESSARIGLLDIFGFEVLVV